MVVISDKKEIPRCKKHNIRYTFFENNPLGAKKNHGLKMALKRKWDYLIEINSDDVIKNELLDIYDTMKDDYIALRNFCFMDSDTLELRQVESKTAYGIGRRYSRKAIEACKVSEVNVKQTCISADGVIIEGTKKDLKPYIAKDLEQAGYVEIIGEGIKLWNDEATAGMDNFSDIRLNSNGFRCRQLFTKEPLAVDIKSDVNIWKFNPQAGTRYNLEDFKKGLPELDGIITSNRFNIQSGIA